MLTHQSWLDAAACLFAILLFSQPTNWVPGIDILDSFICHAWNGQFVYWYAVHTSSKSIHALLTRMHSSRIRTARLLAVSPSMHCAVGVCPGRCLPIEGVCPRGVCPVGCLPRGCLPGGVYPSMH